MTSLQTLADQANDSTLASYYDELNSFDYLYDYSDDHRVWERCRLREDYLRKRSGLSLAHKALWDQFNRWGADWCMNERSRDPATPAKPARPAA